MCIEELAKRLCIVQVEPVIGSTIKKITVSCSLSVLEVLCRLSNRPQHVLEDGCRSAAGLCFGPVIVSPTRFGAFLDTGE